MIVTLSSGNLSITQNAINVLEQRARSSESQLSLWNAESMFDVARLLGDCAARGEDARRSLPRAEQHRRARELHRRRPDPRRAAAAVQRLRRGQLHRGDSRHLLLPDRRDQVRQADHRPRDQAHARRCSTRPSARWCRSTRRCARTSRSGCRSISWSTRPIRCASSCSGASRKSDPYFQMVHTQWGEGLRRVFAQLPDPDWT